MKNKRFKSAKFFLISLFLCVAVIAGIFLAKLQPVGHRFTDSLIASIREGSGNAELSIGSIDREFLSSIRVNDVDLRLSGQTVARIKEIDASVGLFDLARFALGSEIKHLKFDIQGVDLFVNDSCFSLLTSKSEGESPSSVLKELEKTKIDVSISDVNINASLKGYTFEAYGAGLTFTVEKGLSIGYLNAVLPDITGHIPQTEETVFVTGLKAGLDSENRISASIERIYSSESVDIESIVVSSEIHLGDYATGNIVAEQVCLDFDSYKVKADSSRGFIRYDFLTDVFEARADISRSLAEINGFEVNLDDAVFEYNNGSIKLGIKNFDSVYTPGKNSMNVSSEDLEAFVVSVNLQNMFKGSFTYTVEENSLSARVDLKDFRPHSYSTIMERFVPFIKNFVSPDTSVSGFLKAEVNSFEKLEDADFFLELDISKIKAGNNNVDGVVGCNLSLKGDQVLVDRCSLDMFGKKLELNGSFNRKTLLPIGNILFRESDDSVLAQLNFNFDTAGQIYHFDASSPVIDGLYLNGNIDVSTENIITASALLQTSLKDYPIDFYLNRETLDIHIESDGLNLITCFDENRYFVIDGLMDDFSVKLSDRLSVLLRSTISGIFDFGENTYDLQFNDNLIEVSDIFNLSFDLDLKDRSVILSDLLIKNNSTEYVFDGSAVADNLVVMDIVRGKSKASVKAKLTGRYRDELIKVSFNGEDLFADVRLRVPFDFDLRLLGNRQTDYSASFTVGNMSFEAEYSNGKLTINKGKGNLEAVKVSDFDVYVDFVNRTLESSFSVEHEKEMRTGLEKQGAKAIVKAKLDSLSATALNLAGLNAQAVFDVVLKDVYLSDGITIPDNSLVFTVDRSIYKAQGDLVDFLWNRESGEFVLDINTGNGILAFKSSGKIKDNFIDAFVTDINASITLINQFANFPEFNVLSGNATGSVLVKGPVDDPAMYGMIFVQSLDVDLFYCPEQILSLKNAAVTIHDHSMIMPPTHLAAHSDSQKRFYSGRLSGDIDFSSLSLSSLDFHLIVDDKPTDVWIPVAGQTELMMRANVLGDVHFKVDGGIFGISGNVLVSDGYLSFKVPPMPEYFYTQMEACDLDMYVEFGKNIEFYYPDTTDSFVNFTIEEGEKLHYRYDKRNNVASAEGDLSVKSGTIYYFQNDFYVTEGRARVSKNRFSDDFELSFDLTAKLREYDSDGKPVDIFLTLQNATFDNLSPRLSSSNSLSENEIVQILGQSILQNGSQDFSFSSIASMAMLATDTISRLGIIESNKNYSITSTIRDALDLDILSLRSPIVQNMIVDVLPGQTNSHASLIARYLDGTTLFAGKYFGNDFFFRTSVLLKAAKNGVVNYDVGHFMTDDLNLNLELSLEWEMPLGTFSLFTQPYELSVFNFLDNIGFSLSRTIKL